jgi:hypothetical protein
MPAHYITLTATNKRIPVPDYVAQLKKVFENDPDTEYVHGLAGFWPTSGAAIRREFRQSIHERINTRGGQDWRNHATEREHAARRDCRAIRARVTERVIVRRLETPALNRRFAHLLYTDDDF